MIRRSKKGIALILVIFVVALGTIIVSSLSYSTFLSSRSIGLVEHSVQAEYILKSLVNLSRAIIMADQTANYDGAQDPWALFSQGMIVPPAQLGIVDSTAGIDLEISPTNTRIRINHSNVPSAGSADLKYARLMRNLFYNLGFDQDGEQDPNTGKSYDSCEMVANLIDYQDSDQENTVITDTIASINCEGYENNFPKDAVKNNYIEKMDELRNIPGFSPARIRALAAFVTLEGDRRINVNFASDLVLKSLDSGISDQVIEGLKQHIQQTGGFDSTTNFLSFSSIQPFSANFSDIVSVKSNRFQIIGRVKYGDSQHFIKAALEGNVSNQLPQILSMQIY